MRPHLSWYPDKDERKKELQTILPHEHINKKKYSQLNPAIQEHI